MNADPDAPELEWTEAGPRSRRFDDIYFSPEDGLAESRAVFLAGCGLPAAWAGRRDFTVAELGFGAGLNLLALLDLWRETRPAGGQLHVFSVEAFPLTRADAARALAAWPALADLAAPLLAAWPDARPGFHRLDFGELGATLDLAVGDVEWALEAWDGRADAWFLDGFAPSKNPEMWRPEVLALVAARSAPGARAATFTVAGAVRRGLEAAGFTVAKRPGFGRKKERLEAVAPGRAATTDTPARVAVVGAGIAGAALMRALRGLGVEPVLFEAAAPGAGASGNAAALVAPRLDAGGGAVARLHAQAHARAVALYRAETPAAVLATGVVQLESGAKDAARFDRIAAWEGFAPGAVRRLSPAEVAARLDEPEGPGGLELAEALVVRPDSVLAAWAGTVDRRRVGEIAPDGAGWRLSGEGWAARFDLVFLAAGAQVGRLAALGPLRIVRGQAETAATAFAGAPAAWGGYAIPAPQGVLFGATHDRDDTATDVRTADAARNRALLAKGRPRLGEALAGEPTTSRASLRATLPDHMPLAGAVPGASGLFVLTGLGGRGFTLAPLLAEMVAARALGAPSPLPRDLAAAVDPDRYG